MTNVHGMPGQPILPPACVPVTIRKTPLNFTICCLSQFKDDTGEPSVSAQEINPITYRQMTGPGFDPRSCTAQANTALKRADTPVTQHLTNFAMPPTVATKPAKMVANPAYKRTLRWVDARAAPEMSNAKPEEATTNALFSDRSRNRIIFSFGSMLLDTGSSRKSKLKFPSERFECPIILVVLVRILPRFPTQQHITYNFAA